MKSIFLSTFFLSVFLFAACEKDDAAPASDLSGTWQLVEVLADPGDGSGTFEPVDSDRTITFGADGAYTATGDLCTFGATADSETSGIFWPENQNVEPAECVFASPQSGITYTIDGDELILAYPCIEACRHKYRKQ